jgi:hypothetical protein
MSLAPLARIILRRKLATGTGLSELGAKRLAMKAGRENAGRISPLSGMNIEPDKYYRSDYRSEIHPESSARGTCDYCLRANGRIFRGSDLILPGGGFGHHPNCCCTFSEVPEEESPVRNGIKTAPDFGSRRVLNANGMNNITRKQLTTITTKRGLGKGSGLNKAALIGRILGGK